MSQMKWIIYGAGNLGYQSLNKYGKENVACFVDTYKEGVYCDKEVITLDKLKEIWNPIHYKISIAMDVNDAWEVLDELKKNNIQIAEWDNLDVKRKSVLHVYAYDGAMFFDYDESSICAWRAARTVKMLKEMFNYYSDDYINDMDFYVYYLDDVFEASRFCDLLGKNYIFAYSEIYGIDNVVSIPDYKYLVDFIDGKSYYMGVMDYLSKIGMWSDGRAFWTGNLDNDKTRRILVSLGSKYKDKLYINDFIYRAGKICKNNSIAPKEWLKYKYYIDIRGCGWTDRVKYLLAMKRPLLLVDRPYKEYYFNLLKPMVHYVPVKEDLSDLMEKIQLLEDSPGLYESIVNNAFEFCLNNFSKGKIRQELHKRIFKYGTSDVRA